MKTSRILLLLLAPLVAQAVTTIDFSFAFGAPAFLIAQAKVVFAMIGKRAVPASGEHTRLACWRRRPAFADFQRRALEAAG